MDSDCQSFTYHQMQPEIPQCALRSRPGIQLQANDDKDRAEQIKKEKNREAARKHREKEKLKALDAQQQNQDLEKRKIKFQMEVDLLTNLEVQYKTFLLDHCTSCIHCRCRDVPCLVNRPPSHPPTPVVTQAAAPPFLPSRLSTPSMPTMQDPPVYSFLHYQTYHTQVGDQGNGDFDFGSVMSSGGEITQAVTPQPFPYDLLASSLPTVTMQVPSAEGFPQYQADHAQIGHQGYGVSDTRMEIAECDGYGMSGVIMPEVAECDGYGMTGVIMPEVAEQQGGDAGRACAATNG